MTTCFETVENSQRHYSKDRVVCRDCPLLEALLNAGACEGDEIRLLIALLEEGSNEN
jgi:hypothetical protein